MKGIRGILESSIAPAVLAALAACHGSEATFSVSGSVTGTSTGVVVKLNGANDISLSGDGTFKFTGKLLKGETYNVQIVDPADRCSVSSGAGTVNMSDITGVSISCALPAQQTIVLSAVLNGAQESPPVTTSATGVGGLIVVPTAGTMPITGGVTFSGLTPLAINIHQAPVGNPAGPPVGVIVPLLLGSDGLSAFVPPGTAIDAAFLQPLQRGELFFNITTANNQNGEIRGSIQLQGGVSATAVRLDQSQVAPPSGSTAAGTGTLIADLATGRIVVSYITHTVTGTSTAAIHTSTGPTANGASIVLFGNVRPNVGAGGTNLANPAPTAKLDAQGLSDLSNSLLYFQIDSQTSPNGDIRGNITPLPQ